MKGLHKNSLRKVDNPHQWMIDDARMELIQQIKAEVERRKKRNKEEYGGDGLFEVQDNLDKLLSFLSDLEKEEKPMNPTIEKLRALIKMQIRREELNFASLGGGGQTMNIGALEWVLKQLDTLKEQPVDTSEDERINTAIFKALSKKDARDVLKECGVDVGDALDYLKRQSKEQPVELEKEIKEEKLKWRFFDEIGFASAYDYRQFDGRDIDRIASHFYELGRQSKSFYTEELDEEIIRYKVPFVNDKENLDERTLNAIAYHFATWMESKLLHECESAYNNGYVAGQQSKPRLCEGLEEEIDKRWKEWISEDKEQVEGVLPKSEFAFYARHFAQWGAEHLKK